MAELDYGLGTILCKGLKHVRTNGCYKGIPLKFREVSLLYGHKTVVT